MAADNLAPLNAAAAATRKRATKSSMSLVSHRKLVSANKKQLSLQTSSLRFTDQVGAAKTLNGELPKYQFLQATILEFSYQKICKFSFGLNFAFASTDSPEQSRCDALLR